MEMKFIAAVLIVLTAEALSQALPVISLLQQYSQLSTLAQYISASANLTSLLTSDNDFTLLAPSNAAFETWVSDQQNGSLSESVIEATIQYHILQGSFPSSSASNSTQFLPTELYNLTYSNVTGGQRVAFNTGANGQAEYLSDHQAITTIATADILCENGLVQIVDSVLTIPLPITKVIVEENWQDFIQILTKGGYITAQNQEVIDAVEYATDLTFFAPNTAQALAAFDSFTSGKTQSELNDAFDYYIAEGVTYSSSFENGMKLQSVQGDNLTISIVGEDMYVNSAKITGSDYLVANGVVHLIDDILDRSNTSLPAGASKPAVSHSLSTGAKAGIGVGVSLGVILIAAIIFFVVRRSRACRERPAAEEQHIPQMAEMHGEDTATKELHANQIYDQRFDMSPTSPTSMAIELDGSRWRE